MQAARKLAPCPQFTFELRRLHEVDLRLFAHFLHGDALAVDGTQNGMLVEIKIKKEAHPYQNNICDISTYVTVRPLTK